MRIFLQILILSLFLFSCKTKDTKEGAEKSEHKKAAVQNNNAGWEDIKAAVVKISSFDDNRILESGQGFFIAENLIVTKYSLVNKATKVEITPFNENKKYSVDKFVAFDRINDLIILQVDGLKRKPIELAGTIPKSAKSLYISHNSEKTIQLLPGKF